MRKVANYSEESEGRDKGKLFVITEMPCEQGEDWAIKVMLALMQSNVEVPEGFLELGMAGLAQMGLKCLASIKFEMAKPLLTELMDCVQLMPDPKKTHVVRALVPSDIEEIETRGKLKWEVLSLHVDFSRAVDLSNSLRGVAKAAVGGSRVTKTSRRS